LLASAGGRRRTSRSKKRCQRRWSGHPMHSGRAVCRDPLRAVRAADCSNQALNQTIEINAVSGSATFDASDRNTFNTSADVDFYLGLNNGGVSGTVTVTPSGPQKGGGDDLPAELPPILGSGSFRRRWGRAADHARAPPLPGKADRAQFLLATAHSVRRPGDTRSPWPRCRRRWRPATVNARRPGRRGQACCHRPSPEPVSHLFAEPAAGRAKLFKFGCRHRANRH
jgi:hypothetical protein